MRVLAILAAREIRDALRNRWVAASIALLAALALTLALLGAAPGGSVKASALAVTVASLASLSVYLVPLIALMLSFDALAGELERGTMLLLLTYPVRRWQVIAGKFVGHVCVLGVAVAVGYGSAALAVGLDGAGASDWSAFARLLASTVLLGAAFIALGYLASVVVRERATAAGAAIGVWLVMVVLYDLALLGLVLGAEGRFALSETAFRALLLLNPTDAYRLFNLAGEGNVPALSGLSGALASGGLAPALLLGIITLWTAAALAAATALFSRREL